jgi:hypothetical protein
MADARSQSVIGLSSERAYDAELLATYMSGWSRGQDGFSSYFKTAMS